MGEGPLTALCGVMAVMFMFGLDMPKPGPILSDQCRIFPNLFILVAEETIVAWSSLLSKESWWSLLYCSAFERAAERLSR